MYCGNHTNNAGDEGRWIDMGLAVQSCNHCHCQFNNKFPRQQLRATHWQFQPKRLSFTFSLESSNFPCCEHQTESQHHLLHTSYMGNKRTKRSGSSCTLTRLFWGVLSVIKYFHICQVPKRRLSMWQLLIVSTIFNRKNG